MAHAPKTWKIYQPKNTNLSEYHRCRKQGSAILHIIITIQFSFNNITFAACNFLHNRCPKFRILLALGILTAAAVFGTRAYLLPWMGWGRGVGELIV